MQDFTKVKVVVYEDGIEVKTLMVGYYNDQPYTVKIYTPEGADRIYEGATKAAVPA